jgi:hypothetical protein
MSTFYLLPPRPQLGQSFAAFLATWFPGLNWQQAGWGQLTETLEAAAGQHPDVYLVYHEELPEGEDPTRALVDGFGAEEGDDVIQIYPGKKAGEVTSRRWRLPAVSRT